MQSTEGQWSVQSVIKRVLKELLKEQTHSASVKSVVKEQRSRAVLQRLVERCGARQGCEKGASSTSDGASRRRIRQSRTHFAWPCTTHRSSPRLKQHRTVRASTHEFLFFLLCVCARVHFGVSFPPLLCGIA